MPMFHQTPDDHVYVRTDAGTYGDTSANFATDNGSPAPSLPSGITERIYEPGKRHPLIADNNVMDGGPMPWDVGDSLIANYNSLIVAQAARQEAERAARAAAMKAEMDAALARSKQ